MFRYVFKERSTLSSDPQKFPLLFRGGREEGSYVLQQTEWPRGVRFTDGHIAPLFIGGILSTQEMKIIARNIAQELADRYRGQNLLLIQLLEGAVPFCRLVCTNLAECVEPGGLQYTVASLKVSSYLDGSSAQQHLVSLPLQRFDGEEISSFKGYDRIVVLDDLIDAGNTFSWLLNEYLPALQPKEVSAYFMLEKERRRTAEVEATLARVDAVCGKRVPDEWVVGFGLDIRLPGRKDQEPTHLFRGELPGGIYAFNADIEKRLIAEYQTHSDALRRQLAPMISAV